MNIDSLKEKSERNNFPDKVVAWYSKNGRKSLPWRNENRSPYEILTAEFMLQQTDAETVEKIYPKFLSKYPDLEALAESDIEELKELMRPLGLLYRAERMKESAQIIEEKFEGEIPKEKSELRQLPGVGDYIANAVLCFGYSQKKPILDVNVARIFILYFDLEIEGRTRNQTCLWELAESLLPETRFKEYNWGLLDLGAQVSEKEELLKELGL